MCLKSEILTLPCTSSQASRQTESEASVNRAIGKFPVIDSRWVVLLRKRSHLIVEHCDLQKALKLVTVLTVAPVTPSKHTLTCDVSVILPDDRLSYGGSVLALCRSVFLPVLLCSWICFQPGCQQSVGVHCASSKLLGTYRTCCRDVEVWVWNNCWRISFYNALARLG